MSQPPPPYPGDEKGGSYPPPPNPSYPPQYFSNLQPTDAPPSYSSADNGTKVVKVLQEIGENPIHTKCPNCKAEIITATQYVAGTLTWISAGLLCFVGLDCGCCLIPFFIDECKDVIHSCPNCNFNISRHRRI